MQNFATEKEMTVPERRDGEGELEYLRRKEAMFGIWQGDALERINDMETALVKAENDRDKYRLALIQIQEALGVVGKYAMLESTEIDAEIFARDFAPWINIMAHHGIEPYAKPKRARKVASA